MENGMTHITSINSATSSGERNTDTYNKLYARLRGDPQTAAVLDRALADLYRTELEESIIWRTRWKRIGNACISTSKFVVSTAILFDFLAGVTGRIELNVAAGAVNTMALSMLAYSSFAFSQSKSRDRALLALTAVSDPLGQQPPDGDLTDQFPGPADTQGGGVSALDTLPVQGTREASRGSASEPDDDAFEDTPRPVDDTSAVALV